MADSKPDHPFDLGSLRAAAQALASAVDVASYELLLPPARADCAPHSLGPPAQHGKRVGLLDRRDASAEFLARIEDEGVIELTALPCA